MPDGVRRYWVAYSGKTFDGRHVIGAIDITCPGIFGPDDLDEIVRMVKERRSEFSSVVITHWTAFDGR